MKNNVVELLDLPKAVETVENSICRVINERDNFEGSGFIVAVATEATFIATAAHIPTLNMENEPLDRMKFVFEVSIRSGRLIHIDEKHDLALYTVSPIVKERGYLRIAVEPFIPGTPIATCGFVGNTKEEFVTRYGITGSNYPTFVAGIISAQRPAENSDGTYVYQLDCTVYDGMSGGPVFTYFHGVPSVIGIITHSFTLDAGEFEGPIRHPITLAVSVLHLKEILDGLGAAAQEHNADESYTNR